MVTESSVLLLSTIKKAGYINKHFFAAEHKRAHVAIHQSWKSSYLQKTLFYCSASTEMLLGSVKFFAVEHTRSRFSSAIVKELVVAERSILMFSTNSKHGVISQLFFAAGHGGAHRRSLATRELLFFLLALISANRKAGGISNLFFTANL